MKTTRIRKWSELLLDTGKRNNLINCRDSKSSMAEIVLPTADLLYPKISAQATLEAVFPKGEDESDPVPISRDDFIETYAPLLKKSNQVLLYNGDQEATPTLKKIARKAASAIEETGVNIAYLAMGFVHWTDKDDPEKTVMKAPILLAPVSIRNDSVLSPYYLSITDDILVNPTFSYKLQTEYSVKLPEYDEEGGIAAYIDGIKEMMEGLGWSISEECKIGLFSFLKINMYKDLKENAEVIASNPIVSGLLQEAAPEQERAESFEDRELVSVVDADSSQENAIKMAIGGRSFVLQGPPGTGKSQTITNIIAECINAGKKVLFVSEKSAALNVVYDKLKKAGLEDFCLELHSHKANKKDVLDNLVATLKAPKSALSKRAKQEAETKMRAKGELDLYADELHLVRPVIDRSLYQLYEEYAACRMAPDVAFVIEDLETKGKAYLEQAENLLERYAAHAQVVGFDYRKYPWYGYAADGTYATKIHLKEDLKSYLAYTLRVQSLAAEAQERALLPFSTEREARIANEILAVASDREWFCPALLRKGIAPKAKEAVDQMQAYAQEIKGSKAYLDQRFDPKVYDLEGGKLYDDLSVKFKSLFKRFFSKEYRAIKNRFGTVEREEKRLGYGRMLKAARNLKDYQEKTEEFLSLERRMKGLLGQGYRGVDSDFEAMGKVMTALALIDELGFDCSGMSAMTSEEYDAAYDSICRIGKELDAALTESEELTRRTAAYFDEEDFALCDAPFALVVDKFGGILSLFGEMESWCDCAKVLREIKDIGVLEFLHDAIDLGVSVDSHAASFRKTFLNQWIDAILSENSEFSALYRIPHDEAVRLFQKQDKLQFEINKATIRANLSALRPDLGMIAPGSATALLLREGEKKRKKKSIRALLAEAHELIQTIKPCFLMSPLSVSTYLTPDTQFDLVVFDEASQIFPQDAIGAIYRGKQLIVVGDSKQMPPSNFFNTVIEEEEEEENDELTNFESILDICSTFMPQLRLKWHYRSKNEQLIAFSNKNFYDNELITFPSSVHDQEGVGVDYHFVEGGIFDRKSKTNRAEAEAVAEIVFRHIEEHPDQSIGVVAFNIGQQELIDKVISERRQKSPACDAFFHADCPEPFFVKNLETVQGDERDVIVFSTTYAPDETGRFLLNFGPINHAGGERRLNVAATRAKENVVLVSSLHYYDIDLSRSGAVGVRLVREYLEYAEKGTLEAQVEEKNALERQDSDLIKEVGEFLRENGFTTEEKVGRSASRIELAVKQPLTEDYLLAIESDGFPYRQLTSTRDRDRLRQEVLERMGWKYYRLWSADWFRNKTTEKKRLLDFAKETLSESEAALAGERTKKKSAASGKEVNFEVASKGKAFSFPTYEIADHWQVYIKKHDIWAVIKTIVQKESPISEEWLLKRIVQLFGKDKVTAAVKDAYEEIMTDCESKGILRRDGFLYKEDAEIPMLRVPAGEDTIRDVKYIALEELANGLERIVKDNVSVDRFGLFRFLVQRLGFARTSEAMISRLNEALSLLQNVVQEKGDTLLYMAE